MDQKDIIEESIRLRDRGNFSEAIQTLDKLNDANSKSADVFSLIAHCHILNNDLSEALSFLNKAKEIDPSIPSIGWNEARLLLRQKNIPTALRIAQETNARFPNDSEGLGVLGSCLKASNQLEKSLECLNKALSLDPNYPEALINRGLIYLSQKNISACLIDLEAAFELKSHFAPIWPILINLKMERKEYAETIPIIRKMVSIEPNDAENFAKLALCHQHQKELNESVIAYKKAIELKPSFVEARNNLGMVLQDLGQFDEAKDVFSAGLENNSDFAPLFKNFGNLLVEMSEFEGALNAYNRAVEINNNDAETYNSKGNVLKNLGQLDQAIECYDKALSIRTDYPEAYNNLGALFKILNMPDKAIEAYKKAISLKSDYAKAYNNLGNALVGEEKLEEALDAYRKAISIQPDYASAHHNISNITDYSSDDPHFLQVRNLYKNKDLSENSMCLLNFALAKMYEDANELDKAFKHLSKGNALRKKLLGYSINQEEKLFKKIRNTQPILMKSSLDLRTKLTTPMPIFILGMPRSGTTLVEQIVSSHSRVTGGGELNYVAQYGIELAIGNKDLNKVTIKEFRKKYLNAIYKHVDGNMLVTDKTPQNFRFIPLICAAIPEAKIIHVHRDPSATCWSNYKHYFATRGLGYSYDLTDVTAYYRLYVEMMEHWHSQYKDHIYNLNYETLTTEQKSETEKLLSFLELDWEDACLTPHKNKRSVVTASQLQVRKQVYQGSSHAWQKFSPFLNGVLENL